MRPSVGVHGHDDRVGEGARGFDGVVRVHREMERPAGLRRARERQYHARLKALRDLGDAVIPDGIAADVDRAAAVPVRGDDEADDVARERLDPGRAVPCGRRGDRQGVPVLAL
jgi:hypothetical protein